MATYEDYRQALLTKDSWIQKVKDCYWAENYLTELATGNVSGGNIRGMLEKAYNEIKSGEVWAGEDANACALLLWEVRNEVVRISNLAYDARKQMTGYAEEQVANWVRTVDQRLAELDALGKVDHAVRGSIGVDAMKKKEWWKR